MKTLANFFKDVFSIDDPSNILNSDLVGKEFGINTNLKIKDIKNMKMFINEIKNGHSYITDTTWDDIYKYYHLGVKEFLFKTWKTSISSDLKNIDWDNIPMSFDHLNLMYGKSEVRNMNLYANKFDFSTKGEIKFNKSKIDCTTMEINLWKTNPFFDNSCKINAEYLNLDYTTTGLPYNNMLDNLKQLIEDVHNGKKLKQSPSELLGLGKINAKEISIEVSAYPSSNFYSISKRNKNITTNWYELGNGWYFGESKNNKSTLD